MGTLQQNQANRRNSRLSKGPKTPEGKARSAKNALKHGLLSRGVLLPDEDAEAFIELSRRLSEDLNPLGELELVLLERIVDLFWRLRRLRKFEAGILAWYRADLMVRRGEEKIYRAQRAKLRGFEVVTDFFEGAKETDLATSGAIYIHDARTTNALATLSRHETSLERSLHKTLHELERHQASRQGKDVPVPLALDIDVSGAEPEALRITAGREPQAVGKTSLKRKTARPIR
jgi:hypothetical protein